MAKNSGSPRRLRDSKRGFYSISVIVSPTASRFLDSKVVIFDLELTRRGVRRRLKQIQKELGGEGDFDNLKICCLRGKARRFCGNLKAVREQIREQNFEVVIIDPVYKFLLGKEENSNGIVASVLEELTEFCAELGVALIYVHHHSKGNQAGKDSLDRGAGAGAWARDPDALLDLTEHKKSTKEERIFTAELTVREFPPQDKFVVRWKFPLLVRDAEGLDPEELKQIKQGGRPKNEIGDVILAVLRMCDSEGGTTAKRISEASLTGLRTVQRRIKDLMPQRVVKAVSVGGYQLSLAERERVEHFKAEQEKEEALVHEKKAATPENR